MHPHIRERHVVRRFGLGDFVVVVNRNVVNAAGVNIKRLAEVFSGHSGTLNMPAGETKP